MNSNMNSTNDNDMINNSNTHDNSCYNIYIDDNSNNTSNIRNNIIVIHANCNNNNDNDNNNDNNSNSNSSSNNNDNNNNNSNSHHNTSNSQADPRLRVHGVPRRGALGVPVPLELFIVAYVVFSCLC